MVDHLINFRRAALTASFTVFLYPLSIDGVSVNYSFLLFPLFFILLDGKVRIPQEKFLLLMCLYSVIFVTASIYQHQFQEHALRRVVSFALFMTMFTYMFFKIDVEIIESFKLALVVVSVFLSISSIWIFYVSGVIGGDYEAAKNTVGSQRVGFIYLLALWLVYLDRRRGVYLIIRSSILLVILSGLFFTFSRSSIIALVTSFGLYTLMNCFSWLRRPKLTMLGKGIIAIAVVGILFAFLHALFPLTSRFFEIRLVLYLLDPVVMGDDLADPRTSGGMRVFLWRGIRDFVIHNPLTGSGFLGVWVEFGEYIGSAHSQYADVLFRTGFFGFLAYMYVLTRLLRYLYRDERALFWGFCGLLIYGFFHETFKESQGGFVLAILLGMMSQRLRISKVSRTRFPWTQNWRNRSVQGGPEHDRQF